MKTIEIEVSPQGKTKITTRGYAGQCCQDATRDLEKALGKVAQETKTAEYYQTAKTTNRLQAKGG